MRYVLFFAVNPLTKFACKAFVIYCFFSLLLSYLGGERSLLILLHGRPPKLPAFPVSIFQSEVDVSDPHTFLFLKRGILRTFL
jgi:Organic solute transporter Ostalpha